MANTPLELYESAYRFHYHEKKIPEAVRIYESIIRDFPDSNECSYAVIQLQKVKANDITKALKKNATSLYPMLIVAFMSSFIALIVAIVGTLLMFQQLRLEHRRVTLAIASISKLYCGRDADALRILDEMKSFSRQDVLADEIISDIKSTQSAPASSSASSSSQTRPDNAKTETVEPKAVPEKPAAPAPAVRPRAAAPNRYQGRQNKSPYIVNPDSISYF